MAQQSIASAQTTIDVPFGRAWELLRDLSLAHNYVPGVIKTEITTDCREGVGASRKVFQGPTTAIDETVEEWNEGGGFLIRLHREKAGPPFPFREAWFRYAIEQKGSATLLTTSLIYTMRWGLLGRLLDRALLNRIVRGRIWDVALSLKTYYESGECVTPDRLREAKRSTAKSG